MKCEMKIEKLCIKILVCLICNPNISLILYSLQFNIDEYFVFGITAIFYNLKGLIEVKIVFWVNPNSSITFNPK